MSDSSTFRRRTYEVLERSERGDKIGRVIDVLLIVLIAANVLMVVFETVDHIYEAHQQVFDVFEKISVAIFTVEYTARVWSSVEGLTEDGTPQTRKGYMLSPMAIIDLLAILPFFLSVFIKMDLRFLRVLRLLRVFKLTRYSSAMTMLFNVLREERHAFTAAMSILMVLLVLAASGAYLVEHEMQPDKFGSIPQSMWWAMVTLTTVGYGDVTPITPLGRLFGGLVAITGIGMAALPAGILASGLADQLRRSREALKDKLRAMLEDGEIDSQEANELEELRRDLGLSKRLVEDVVEDMKRAKRLEASRLCPHCGKHLGH